MARRGRKRNVNAERYPGGQIKQPDETPIGLINRARRAYLSELRNPLFSTELGFLHLAGLITDIQRLAGEGFAKLVQKYRVLCLDGPNGRPKIAQMQPHVPGTSNKEHDPELIQRIKQQYDEVFAAVEDHHGHGAMKLVYQLCVDDRVIVAWWEREQVKKALNTIAMHLRLEGVKR